MSSGIKTPLQGKLFLVKLISEVFLLFNTLTDRASCDVLIIGGGIAGLYTAHELSKTGQNIIVAEQNTVGSGRTSAGKDVILTNERQHAAELQKTAELIYETSVRTRDVFTFCDKPDAKKEMRKQFLHDKFGGKDVFFLSGEETTDEFSFDFESGIYEQNGAIVFNARSFAEKLATYLSVNGISVVEHTKLLQIEPTKNGFCCKTSADTEINAKIVIDTRCFLKKRAVFCAKTKDGLSCVGWHNDCVIKDTYKNRMTFYRTHTGQICMCFERGSLLPRLFGAQHIFSYMQQILSTMFFAINETSFCEKRVIFQEDGSTAPKIQIADGIPDFYRFNAPYSDGILSTIAAARAFARDIAKS